MPWKELVPAFANTLVIYLLLIAGIRIAGRRQMGQLTALDLLVILLLGSAVETSLIGPSPKSPEGLFHDANVSLAAGLLSAATLLLSNRILAAALRSNKRLRHLVVGGPLLLVHDARIVEENMKRAGLTHANLMEAIRGRGYGCVEDIRFAVLEPDGEVHVLPLPTRVRSSRVVHGDDS